MFKWTNRFLPLAVKGGGEGGELPKFMALETVSSTPSSVPHSLRPKRGNKKWEGLGGERGEITRCYFNKNFLLDFDLITVQPFRFNEEQCARICGLCNQYLAKISDLGTNKFFLAPQVL